jgi:hypothetical protein
MLAIIFAIVYTRKTKTAVKHSQSKISDKELILYIDSRTDKIVNFKTLMQEFDLTKFEAKGRLNQFLYNGLLRILRTRNGLQSYYTLAKPIETSYDLQLSDDPFMTIEDLMLIFKHYDYQVSLQELCLCTGLPIKVLLEEMKYFEKEGVVKCLVQSSYTGSFGQRVYKLCEPYISNPDQYISLKAANFELKEIYKNIRNA